MTSQEKIRTIIVEDHDDLGRMVAWRIADLIRARAGEGRPAVLGLATGSTPIGVYRELIRLHRDEGLSFADVVTFNLDEYYPMDPGSLHSYHRFMWENLFSHLDIPPANVHIPPGDVPRERVEEECRRYEEAIRAVGGIDLQILGIGRTGHIGFNEPGSGLESRTRLITLDLVTRKDAAADFFGDENVPREAVTMGVATILEAREIVILATGEHKAEIVRRAVEGEVDHEVAATFLQRHAKTTFYVDPRGSGLAHAGGDSLADRTGALDRIGRRAGGRLAVARDREGHPQAHPAGLFGASALLPGGRARIARRAQRRRLQRPRGQDPWTVQARPGEEDRLLLAASR